MPYTTGPPGTYFSSHGATFISDCVPCEEGFFSNNETGMAECRLVPAGSYGTDDPDDTDGFGVTVGASVCMQW